MSPAPGLPSKVLTQPRPGPRRPVRHAQVRARRRPRRPRAGLGPRDGGPGGGGHAGQAAAGSRSGSTCSATSSSSGPSGPSRRRSPPWTISRRIDESRGAVRRPGGGDPDGGGGEGGGQGRRLARRGGRGRRLRRAGRARAATSTGTEARRPAGPGADEHPGGQGGRARRRIRARREAGLARPTTPSGWPTPASRRRRRPAMLGGGYVRDTHHAGGIEGGISTGSPIVARVSMKPLATLNRPDARDGGRGDQGVHGLVQGAHRRHRGAGHGGGGRDDDGAGAGLGGAAQVRGRLGRGVPPQPPAATWPPLGETPSARARAADRWLTGSSWWG